VVAHLRSSRGEGDFGGCAGCWACGIPPGPPFSKGGIMFVGQVCSSPVWLSTRVEHQQKAARRPPFVGSGRCRLLHDFLQLIEDRRILASAALRA
jgi:hypothetical protein